jgi:1,4-dihydroxy-6-naphthoate synthase
MRRYAQEQSDEVLWAHVDLYVNEWTRELGPAGREALATLARLAGEQGRVDGPRDLEVL